MKRVFTSFGFKSLFILTTVFILTQTSFATTAVRPSDDDLSIGARAIVRGKVISIESAADENTNRIYTYITVKVQEVIKGQITERRIVIKELGGQAGDRISVIYGNPQFKRGERVFLYLDTWADGSLRTYQMFLGKFSIIEKNGRQYVYRDMSSDSVVFVPNPNGEPQGPSTDRMELSAYIDMVRSRQVANLDAARAFEEKYYSGVLLRSQPPEFQRISSVSGFSPEFTFLGNARWFEPDTGQAVTYTVNPVASSGTGFPPLAVPESDVAAAANAWSVVPGCALRISYAGQLTQCYTGTGTQGINVVSNNCDGRNAPSSTCSGILAWGGYSGGTAETKIINGTTFQRITQGFISFNPYATCYFGNSCNVQEITTHELGHALGLGHSADSTATMFGYAHFDGRCASIKTDDANGIKFIYPGAGGGPGPLSITTTSLAAGLVNTSYNQALVCTGGTGPFTWALVAGQGSLPAGLSLSAGGIISGAPTTAGTSNFTVKVTDSVPATVQKALSIVVTAGGAPLDSQFVSQTVPTSLQPGQGFSVNLKFLNIGTQTWSGSAYWLVSQNPALNQTWGGNGVPLSSYSIAPGQQLDLTFTAYAPTAAGTYNFQWQVYQNGGVGFFGQPSANVAIQVGAPPPPTSNDSVGLYEPNGGAFFFKYSNISGPSDYAFTFGPANQGWTPVVGDWDGDGIDTIGLYYPNNGAFYIRNSNTSGIADIYITYGPAAQGWLPVIGDWDGNGTDTVGLYNPANGNFYLRNSNTVGYSDLTFAFGPVGAGWVPIAGDWNGDGVDTIGLFNPSTGSVQLRNTNTTGAADVTFTFTGAGPAWMPVVGEWDGNGTSTLGLFNQTTGVFLLRNSNTTGSADATFTWDAANYTPLAGKWH